MLHIPVLTCEVSQYLNPKQDENFIDGTIDGGGHTKILLEKIKPEGKVLGIDLDEELLDSVALKFQKEVQDKKLVLVNDNFKNLREVVKEYNFENISGILLDLGLSLWHLEKSQKGFSFQKNEILDMRYDKNQELTARKIINTWPEKDIEQILKEYSQERHSRRIAKEIIRWRKKKPIVTTFDLVNIIRKAVPRNYERGRIHFATRAFQVLRIAVNQELENLRAVLPQVIEVLKCGGRAAIISFNSLEDRIVKNFFKEKAREEKIKILTKKPIRPAEKEIKLNPRARSAKLRAAIKL